MYLKRRPPQRRSRPNTRFLGIRSRCFTASSVHCLRPTLSPPPLSRDRRFRLTRLVALDRKQQTLLALVPLGQHLAPTRGLDLPITWELFAITGRF